MEKILLIEWVDSFSEGGWGKIDHFNLGTPICKSIGFVMKNDKDVISISQSHSEFENFGDVISIPKRCILKTKVIKMIKI